MSAVRPWDPQSELRYLWSRSLNLDSYRQELERRKRAGCPSPEPNLRREIAAIMAQRETTPEPSFQPINLAIRQPVTPPAHPQDNAQGVPKPHEETHHHGNGESERQQASGAGSTRRSSPEDMDAARPSLPDRDWKVVRIQARRRTHGIVEHLVQWADTEHPTSVLRQYSDGRWTIDVAGVEWDVAGKSPTRTDTSTGELTQRITWKQSWHFDWELPKEAVAQFEQGLGEVKTNPVEMLEPSWWTWEEYDEWYSRPETEPQPSTKKSMSLDHLQPEVGADYTISFLEQMRRELFVEGDLSKLPKKTILRFLNLRIRQRLQFPAEFLFEGQVHYLERPERIKALLVYIFGTAWVKLCSCCANQPGPLPKCVSWMDDFSGACGNCVFKRQRQQCDYHARNAFQAIPKIGSRYSADDLSGIDSSSPLRSTDITARSSVDFDGVEGQLTPASSQDEFPMKNRIQELRSASPSEEDVLNLLQDLETGARSTAGGSTKIGSTKTSQTPPKRRMSEEGAPRINGAAAVETAYDADGEHDEPIPKRQRQASQGAPSVLVEHRYCSGSRNAACTDPVAGVVLPDGQGPLVFSHDRFQYAGEATDEQVRYVISKSDCAATERLEETWQMVLGNKRESQDEHRWPSKESYISMRLWPMLNDLVERFCPWSGHGQTVDLTGD